MILPYSRTFDQLTMSKLIEHDPLVQRFREFFALFDWSVVPEPVIDPTRPGKRPHPQSASLKALLLKVCEGYDACTDLRRFLLSHPLLVLELGFRPTLNVDLRDALRRGENRADGTLVLGEATHPRSRLAASPPSSHGPSPV